MKSIQTYEPGWRLLLRTERTSENGVDSNHSFVLQLLRNWCLPDSWWDPGSYHHIWYHHHVIMMMSKQRSNAAAKAPSWPLLLPPENSLAHFEPKIRLAWFFITWWGKLSFEKKEKRTARENTTKHFQHGHFGMKLAHWWCKWTKIDSFR